MKIYLAGRVSKRPILQEWASMLEEDGHEIVSRWSKHSTDHIKQAGLSERAADAERERFAREDIEDIYACDCMQKRLLRRLSPSNGAAINLPSIGIVLRIRTATSMCALN